MTDPTPDPPSHSALYLGTLRHRRITPKRHEFRYPAYQVLVDLSELANLPKRLPLFGHNRFHVTGLYDRDYMGTAEEPIRAKLTRWLAERGEALGDRRVLLLTNLRVLGYVFNPVSYYYILEEDGRLACAVAEINNTFGEAYAYLMRRDGHSHFPSDASPDLISRFPKVFHVSPFVGMDAVYEFRLTPPQERLAVHIDEFRGDSGEKFFDATLLLTRRPLTTKTLAFALFCYVHMPLLVFAWIHWQALKLWWKGVPYFHKPEPPVGVLRRVEQATRRKIARTSQATR